MGKKEPVKHFVEMQHARHDDQRAIMQNIKDKQVCPFCPEGIAVAELNPTLKAGEYWTVHTNRWPYKSTKHHLIFVVKKHAEHLHDLTTEAAHELMDLFRWAEKEYHLGNGTVAMRFGEPSLTGATVRHLHAHMIVADPDTSKPEYEDIKFRMGPKSKKNSP